MTREERTALDRLLSLYFELYPCREVFKAKLFPYTPEELSCIFSSSQEESKLTKDCSVVLREDVQKLKTIEQVKEFCSNLELLDGTYDTLAENRAASELTVSDYKYIYSILYSTPIKGKVKKEVLVGHIVKYFKGIDRAQALKP